MQYVKIGEVSQRLGLSQRRIIEYEKAGLISPKREPLTRDRLFSPFEIAQLRRIQQLMHKQGFTIRSLIHLASSAPCWKLFSCQKADECPAFTTPGKECFEILQEKAIDFCGRECTSCVKYISVQKAPKIKFFRCPKEFGETDSASA